MHPVLALMQASLMILSHWIYDITLQESFAKTILSILTTE